MSLRARLALAVVLVTAVLVLSGVGLAALVRASDIDQVNHQLVAVSVAVSAGAESLRNARPMKAPLPATAPEVPYTELFVGGLSEDGRLATYLRPALNPDARPVVSPADAAAHTPPRGSTATPFAVPSTEHDRHFQVASVARPGGGWILVALPTDRMDAAYRRIVAGLILAGSALVATLALVAWWVERLSLRPIDNVADAANAIAAGDLERRVQAPGGGTEAGHLARAFNVMVDERQAWEEQLRRFVADASHELRTPLTTIVGVLELHRSGVLPDGDRLDDALRRAGLEARRMSALLEDLLLLARLDQGRPLADEPVDLGRLSRDAVHDARITRPTRRIRINVAPTPLLQGDESRLRQVVTNLVANAMTHTDAEAEVRVTVRLARPSDEGVTGPACVLEVTDDGPGMTADQARHVFERFYRIDAGRTRAKGGSGLGLSIVHSIVAAHGGQVSVRTAPGQGSTFRVVLPLSAPRGQDPAPTTTGSLDRPHVGPSRPLRASRH